MDIDKPVAPERGEGLEPSVAIVRSKDSAILIPANLVRPRIAELKAAGFHPRRMDCTVQGFQAESYAITIGSRRDRADRLEQALAVVFGASYRPALITLSATRITSPRTWPLVVMQDSVIMHDPFGQVGKDFPNWKSAKLEFVRSLQLLASISGRKVFLHLRQPLEFHEPIKGQGDDLHVMMSCSPPGELSVRRYTRIFGLQVALDGNDCWGNNCTRGRGIIISESDEAKDDAAQPVIQILGNTWYILPPLLKNFHGGISGIILSGILMRAWNQLCRKKDGESKNSATRRRKECADLINSWWDGTPNVVKKLLVESERKITDAQRELADLNAKRHEYLEMVRLLGDGKLFAKNRETLQKELREIERNPLVVCLEVYDSGVHVHTRELLMTHGELQYRLGAYVIRVSSNGSVSIWPEKSVHFNGEPHPHVAKEGSPCFGNAAGAILKASGEMRIGDLMRYVLRWLTEGYSPGHARHKLEEWPLVGEERFEYAIRLTKIRDTGVPQQPLDLSTEITSPGGITPKLESYIEKVVDEVTDEILNGQGVEKEKQPQPQGAT